MRFNVRKRLYQEALDNLRIRIASGRLILMSTKNPVDQMSQSVFYKPVNNSLQTLSIATVAALHDVTVVCDDNNEVRLMKHCIEARLLELSQPTTIVDIIKCRINDCLDKLFKTNNKII